MNKLRLLFILFVAAFAAIALRLFYIQVLAQGSYSADYTTTKRLSPQRGRILDRNREPLAINQTKYLLYVEPQKIKHKDDVIQILDENLHMGEATLAARIDMSKTWAAVTDNISDEMKTRLEEKHIEGLGFQAEEQRFYPEASLAAHLLGFLGKNTESDRIGYFGVEGYYDKDLTGLPGVIKSERDLLDRPIFVGTQERVDAQDGRTIVLTVDKSVQHIIKEHLKEGIDTFKAKSGCVIAVQPYTMAVLGLVCLPDFDPEYYFDYSERDFKNWIISSLYEPGSTFKPLVMAAALEEEKVKPDDRFDEKSAIKIGEYTIRNWNDKYEGMMTVTHILEKSSNIGMVHIGSLLGKEKMNEYIQQYGFGDYTQIDLQGEITGQVKPLDQWYPIDEATMAFGQGISVTGIQLVRAFASVINGGYLMRPYVVKEVIEDGYVKEREPQLERRVLSEKTSETMKQMLVSTVKHAEATWKVPKGFTFGGKTGTAQIALQGTYDASKTIASFIGFAPAKHPAFLMLVVIQEPESSSWGSETAAPLFFDIAQDLLIYYNVSPDS